MTNRPRISPTGMEPQFQCRRCPQPARWLAGGASLMNEHLIRVHDIDRDGFPNVVITDAAGYMLDFSGSYMYEGRGQAKQKRRPPGTGIDGLIRTVKTIINISQGVS